MITLVLIWQIVVGDPVDALALQETAPTYLTVHTAWDHMIAARAAGQLYQVDPNLLLSIAHHESRYQHTEVTAEPGGKVSCGVMTPEPTHDKGLCRSATASVIAGYLSGARHLRGWLSACRGNVRCALLGYAGGYFLIAACSREHVMVCDTPWVFLRRADMIAARSSAVACL